MTKPHPVPQLRVAAYCRAAGGKEQNAALELQMDRCKAQISANPNWAMAGIFADAGDSRSKRPEFHKMLRKCRQGKIDLVLVSTISRFSRNMADCLDIMRELRELGIAVIFEKENINTMDADLDMITALTAAFAKAECERLTLNSAHISYMSSVDKHTGKTWKKTIRLPGRPEKTMIFRTE